MERTRGQQTPASGQAGFSLVELLVAVLIIGIVAAIALSIGFHAFESARLGRSVADLRSIADAVHRYKLDYSTIPTGGLQRMEEIAPTLQAVSRDVPVKDGWGNDFYYQDIVVAGGTSYRLYSYGKGGAPDGVVSGNWVDFHSDIVVEGGVFIQSKY